MNFFEEMHDYIKKNVPDVKSELLNNERGLIVTYPDGTAEWLNKYSVIPTVLNHSTTAIEKEYKEMFNRHHCACKLIDAVKNDHFLDNLFVHVNNNMAVSSKEISERIMDDVNLLLHLEEDANGTVYYFSELSRYDIIRNMDKKMLFERAKRNTMDSSDISINFYLGMPAKAMEIPAFDKRGYLDEAVSIWMQFQESAILSTQKPEGSAVILVDTLAKMLAEEWDGKFEFFFISPERVCISRAENGMMEKTKRLYQEFLPEYNWLPDKVYQYDLETNTYSVK